MLHLRALGVAALVAFPLLTWATPISSLDGMARHSAPKAIVSAWGDGLNLQWSTPLDAGSAAAEDPTDARQLRLDDECCSSACWPLVSSLAERGNASSADISVLGGPESERGLTTFILIVMMIGAVLKYFTSPAFHEFLFDVYFPKEY